MRSPWVMKGYYKDPERTREAFTEDGWLKTGDKGAIDEDGRLRITGRIKEIFKTAKGKYVAPVPIENKLQLGGNIEASCVTGADRAQPLAIILLPAPLREAVRRDPKQRELIETSFAQRLEELNAMLDPHERLGFVVLVADEWTQESGHVTGTLKVKRDSVDASYSAYFDVWAQQDKPVVWHGF
jgi:long-subunit acyl-CoA synthetase (AMP-forming)